MPARSRMDALGHLRCRLHPRRDDRRHGRLVHHPTVNACWAGFSGGFNVLRPDDRALRPPGRRLLRFSAIASCRVYGGLLVVTYWQFNRTPTGFIPQQDKGYLLLNVQLPDSASVERTETRDGADRKDRPRHAGRRSHGRNLRTVADSERQRPNLGSMYVMLKEFDERAAYLTADAIAADLQERCRREVSEAIVSVFGAPPIDGLGTTGGFKLMIEDRGNLGLGQLQRVSEQVVAARQ